MIAVVFDALSSSPTNNSSGHRRPLALVYSPSTTCLILYLCNLFATPSDLDAGANVEELAVLCGFLGLFKFLLGLWARGEGGNYIHNELSTLFTYACGRLTCHICLCGTDFCLNQSAFVKIVTSEFIIVVVIYCYGCLLGWLLGLVIKGCLWLTGRVWMRRYFLQRALMKWLLGD